MKKDKKKLAHIEVKDNGLIVANKVGDKLADLKTSIINECLKGLIKGSNEKSIVKYKIQQNINLKAFQLEVGKLTAKTKKEVKTTLNNDKTVNLTPNQVSNITSVINKGLLFLKKDAVKQYQNTLNDMYLKVKSAEDLKTQLQKHIDSGLNLGVVYQNGREYQFDTYFEMKARTDIQVDIKDNLVESGREVGVIFYITSYYGDCAKDHAEWQGKIYVDDKWESIAPKDRIEEIDSYIKANDIKTVKFVTEDPDIKLTTRPNCRHYFMPIDLDSVLGVKNDKDLNKLRQENGLNFNGKYKPEKYEALQKQRYNERKIRAEKQEIDKLEHTLALKPNDYKSLQSEIRMRENNVAKYQKDQRELIKQYDNLERRYNRETLGNRVTLGAEKQIGLGEVRVNYSRSELRKLAKVDKEVLDSKEYNQKYDVLFNEQTVNSIRTETKTNIRNNRGDIKESYSIIDPSGNVVRRGNLGDFGEGQIDMTGLRNNKNLTITHNHPLSSAFSIDDLRFLINNEQVSTLVAGGHNGTLYKLSVTNKTKIPKDIENRFNSVYNEAVESGLTISEATDVACLYLNKAFNFDYRKE